MRRNYARERSETSRKVRPLGNFIVDQIHKRIPLPALPRIQPRSGVATAAAEPHVPAQPTPAPHSARPHRGRDGNTREAPVLHACLKWLHTRGVFVWRNNSGTAWINGQPVSFGYPGSADILGILPDGRFLAVECKSATGRQSDKQVKFQQKIEANSGVYLLVRSEQELEEKWARLSKATA